MATKKTPVKPASKPIRVDIADANEDLMTVKEIAEKIAKLDQYIIKVQARAAHLEKELENLRDGGTVARKLVDQGKKLYQLNANLEQEI